MLATLSVGPKLGAEAQSPHLKLDGPPGVVHPNVLNAIKATIAAIHLRGRLDIKKTIVRSFLDFRGDRCRLPPCHWPIPWKQL